MIKVIKNTNLVDKENNCNEPLPELEMDSKVKIGWADPEHEYVLQTKHGLHQSRFWVISCGMDHYVPIYMGTSFSWWLFSTNIEFNPIILKMVDDEMILWAFTRFSPGVHPVSLLFYSILASKFTDFPGIL